MPVWLVFGVQSRAKRTFPSGVPLLGDAAEVGDGALVGGVAADVGDGLDAPGPQAAATTAMESAAPRMRFMCSGSAFDSKYETPSPKRTGTASTSRKACFLRRY
jgi:hypothetical protein